MVNIIFGIIILISFVGLVIYCVKGYNMTIGVGIISLLWTILAIIGNAISPVSTMEGQTAVDAFNFVFHQGPVAYAQSMLVPVFFGAFFGRILLERGITTTVIKKTVELGGNHAGITMVLLIIVVGLAFTAIGGLGSAMAVGMVVLPILLSLGIPKIAAFFAFFAPIMAASFVSPGLYAQYSGILGVFDESLLASYSFEEYFNFGIVAMIIAMIGIIAVCLFLLRKGKKSQAWAASISEEEQRVDAPWYSWISLILPILLVVTLHLAIGTAFIAAIIYALLTTGGFKGKFTDVCSRISRYFADGATDVAPIIGYLLFLAMLVNAASYVTPYFQAIFGGIIPTSLLVLTIVMAVIIPLGFFRGPTNLVGCGAAIAGVILASASWPIAFIFPLFFVTTNTPQSLDVTQSWVAWGIGYTGLDSRDYLKVSIPYAWITGALLCFVSYFMYLAR